MGERVPVYISRELYEKVKRLVVEQGGFASVEELVEFLLREAVAEQEEIQLSEEDRKKVEERLRALGYI